MVWTNGAQLARYNGVPNGDEVRDSTRWYVILGGGTCVVGDSTPIPASVTTSDREIIAGRANESGHLHGFCARSLRHGWIIQQDTVLPIGRGDASFLDDRRHIRRRSILGHLRSAP